MIMKILKFINENAIVATLNGIGVETIIRYINRRSDRKYDKDKEKRADEKYKLLHKAKLHIEDKKWDSKETPNINLFMTDFQVSLDDKENLEFQYRKNVLNEKKYKHMRFYLKNIGDSDINELNICVVSKNRIMLCPVGTVKMFIDYKGISYGYLYDREILKGDIILLDIAYLEESEIFSLATSELLLIYKDSLGKRYEQDFFLKQKNLYEPIPISYKEYREFISADYSFDKFKRDLVNKKINYVSNKQ